MKHTKKIITSVLVLLAVVGLASCKKQQFADPYITGADHVELEVTTGKDVLGNVFDVKKGVKAYDPKTEADLTSEVKVDEGGLNINKTGVYNLTYTVTNKGGITATVKRAVKVVDTRTFANGVYNYKFATPEVRNAFFGAAESHLLDNVYGGVPLFVNSGMSIYSPRVQLPVENYVPVIGWGATYGKLSKDDTGLDFSDGSKGKTGEYTYRGAFSSNPTTFNQWLSDDSISSDAAAFMLDSLYDFEFNSTKDAYELNPSMAADAPTALNPRMEGQTKVSKTWRVPIKDGLEFKLHPKTDAKYQKTAGITAQTFVDTFKYAIDNAWFRAIAGGSHFWGTSTPVTGAKAYYDGKDYSDAKWAGVGLKVAENENAIDFEFDNELSEWNLKYWLSSNTMSPVHLEMVKDLGKSYGTTPETTAYTGGFYLDTYQPDKLLKYIENDKYHTTDKYNYTGYNFAIISTAELIFEEFKAGKLDASGIPLTEYETYKDNPGVRKTPGSTTFRMNINALGTLENQKDMFPNSNWTPTPILSDLEFRQALYYGIDRKVLAHDVLKTSDPGMYLFSNAYLVDPETGKSFRDTEEGLAVGKDLNPNTHGFNPDKAKALFLSSVKQGIGNGKVQRGTKKNPTKIQLEVAVQAGSTAQAQLGSYVKSSYENLFKDTVNHVQVEITVLPVEFPGIYYDKQLVGNFDLGMGGISGSTLDAASFLEVFTSDNRGGFTLNWGFDTSIPNIPVTYNKPGAGEVTEYWSFDAITSVLNGSITVLNGREDLSELINDVIDKVNKLPEVGNVKLADKDAIYKAYGIYDSLTPGAKLEVTNAKKLIDLKTAVDKLVDKDNAEKLDVAIAGLPANPTAADLEAIQALVADYGAIKDKTLVKKFDVLVAAYAKAIDAAITDLPATITLDDADAIDEIGKAIAQINALVGKDADDKQKPSGVTKGAEFEEAKKALDKLTENE